MKLNFIPTIWPEEELPPEAIDYKSCEVCTQKSRVIWGEGNPKAPIIIILDNPGGREDKEGKEYVCGTRQTLQAAIYEVGLDIDNVYVTYLLKCRPFCSYNKERAGHLVNHFLFNKSKRSNLNLLSA